MSIYAVSDLHGYLNLYKQIKVFLKPEDKVIFLGDAGDRGPQPWETIKMIAADPQWIYLMGNHEHMLAGAMCEYLEDIRAERFLKEYPKVYNMQALVAYNGGGITLNDWVDDGANPEWINFLLHLPYTFEYINQNRVEIHLSHAGYTPDIIVPNNYDLIWSREHFSDKWPKDFDNVLIVHGHTPCQYFDGWIPEDGALWYCGCHKIDIDQGTYISGQALLLDLDTFDEHIFQTEVE